MREIIAIHGWGGDKQIWKAWEEYFTINGWLWQNFERGYGEEKPSQPNWNFSCTANNQRVLLCHSLGTHLIDKQILKAATDIVLISSFSSFIPNDKNNRPLKIGLKGMYRAFGTSQEQKMLHTFFKKACDPHTITKLPSIPITQNLSIKGREKLKQDLIMLMNTNGLPPDFPKHAAVLKIYSEEDLIVSPSADILLLKDLQKHLKNEPISWVISGGGHYLIIMPEIIQRVERWLVEVYK